MVLVFMGIFLFWLALPSLAGNPAGAADTPMSFPEARERESGLLFFSTPPFTESSGTRADRDGATPRSASGSAFAAGRTAAPRATVYNEESLALPESFAGQSLDAITRTLGGRYAGHAPLRWGEHLDGIVRRLPEESLASYRDILPPPGRTAGNRTIGYGNDVTAEDPADGFLPGAVHTRQTVVALTFDACGGKRGESYDAGIIALLREHAIPATLFVTSQWMRANPEALRELAADPLFEIAAHGERHKPCSVSGRGAYGITGTTSIAGLVREVEGNARAIEQITGIRPRWFRSGTGYYDNVAVMVIHDLGFGIAGYSIAGDEGATLSAAQVENKTLAAGHGDILIFHMNHPCSGTRDGLRRALSKLKEKGCLFVHLPRPVLAQQKRPGAFFPKKWFWSGNRAGIPVVNP